MTIMPIYERVPPPSHPPADLLDHEAECRTVLAPLVDGVLDRAEAAGWNRRSAATALMFLAAAQAAAANINGTKQ